MTSTAIRSTAHDDALPEDRPSDDDIFGMARYLADAVEHGDISEEDGATALSAWAAPDPHVLEQAANHLPRDSETEHLLRAAYELAA